MLEFSTYHKILRISSVVCASVLLFQAGLISQTTATLATHTQLYLASVVGVTAGSYPAETNQTAIELTQKNTEQFFNEEASRQNKVTVSFNSDTDTVQDQSTFILAALLFIILILIVLNYSLEFFRSLTFGTSKKANNDSLVT